MKKQLLRVSLFLLIFFLQTTLSAQCTYLSAVSDLTLNCTSFGPDKTGIAYNPNQNLYYSVTAGSTSYTIETFAGTGGAPLITASQGANYRGYWWNPTTSKPEGNTFSVSPVTTNSINASGYPTGVTGTAGPNGQPSDQAAGTLNLSSTNQILYYDNNTLFRYSRTTGVIISSVTVSGIPAGANIHLHGIIYTGIAGSEVGLYDYTNRRILFIDYTTGIYTNYCQLPASAPTPFQYNFAYANNRVFLYDQGNTRWIGYPITGPSCPGENIVFNAGGYVERSAFSLGSSWSVEAWIKPSVVTTTFWNSVVAQDYWLAPGGEGFAIRVLNDSVGVECPTGGGASTFINARATVNAWTHVAATYGNGILTFYKDGIFVGARAVSVTNSTKPFHIGARNDNSAVSVIDGFNGAIDEVRVWNTTRSQCDIQTYMDAEIQANATNLLANYHFNQGVAGSNNTTITLLDDATTNANDANLVGLTLSGASSNFNRTGAVTSQNYNANPAPTSSLTVKGNGNTIANNLAVISTTNNTDFGSAFTRTFVITNTGSGPMRIGKPYLTGANPTDFTVSTAPATVIAAAASTTFVVTFAPTTGGVKSASVNINTDDCSKPVHKFLIGATSTVGEAFDFDGANDAIAVPNISINNQSFTIEFWAKRSAANPVNCYAISQGTTGSYGSLQIGFTATNTFKFGFWNDDLDLTNSACSDGQYHHWACVYKNGTTEGFNRFVYLDGTLLYAQRSTTTYIGTGTFYIGRNVSAGGYFDGLIDEVRVWNTARSQCEIQSFKDCEIASIATGLIANYHFNQGAASGANSTQTLVADATGGAHTGILTGAALSGTTSNWVAGGGVASGSTTAASPTSSITINGNGNGITNGSTSAALTNFTDFGSVFTRTFVIDNTGGGTLNIDSVDILGTGAARFYIVSFPSRTITTGTTSLVVAFNPNAAATSTASINILTNDCSKPVFTFVISGTGTTGAALAFSGSHTLSIPHSTAFNLTSALTLEAWVKTTYAGESYIITKNDDSWYLAISGGGGTTGKASFFLNGVTPGGWLTGTSVISDGNWHHVAGTYDGSMMRLYVDGDLEAQIAETGAVSTGINTVRIGSRTNATPLNFTGSMDEIRIWSTARSACDIQRYMNAEIPTTFPGLVANYHFNQGIAGANNAGVNSLTSSAGGNTGTLSNFALTGTASNWIAPGGVVSSFTTVSTNSPTLTVTGNGNNIADGSTSASATNFTDFGGLSTRTFVIANAAGSTLTIGTPYITGANASEYSVTTVPAASVNPGSTSSFVVTFNPTAAGTRTATINFVTNDCARPVFDFVVSGTVTAGASLKFDGANDYVKRNETNFGTGDFCIELWVKPASFSAPNGDIYLVTNRSNDFSGPGNWYVLGIQPGGQLSFVMGAANLSGLGGISLLAPSALSLNTWQHVAVSRTGTLFGLYINGIQVASGTDVGLRDLSAGYNIVTFGAWGSPLGQRYFAGEMDEIRLWSTNRTQCQIQANMRCEIPTTATNLIGNYHFNQGAASGNNTGVANLTDVSASAANGVFNNIALTGATSNFVAPGGVTSGSTAAVAITPSITVTGNGFGITYGATSTSTPNLTNFNGTYSSTFVIDNTATGTLNIGTPFFTGANASEFTVTALPAGAITTGTTSFVVAFTPTSSGTKSATVNFYNNDCSKPIFNFVITATTTPAAALNFNGSDVVDCGTLPNLDITQGTWEAWVNLSGLSQTQRIIFKETTDGSGSGAYELYYSNPSGKFQADIKIGAANYSVASVTSPVAGTWYHLAATYGSGNGLKLYVNGILEGNNQVPTGAMNPGTGHLSLGASAAFPAVNSLTGTLDQVRIWSQVQSQCNILAYMNCEIAGAATNLKGNYKFNEGITGGDNSAVTTLPDLSGLANTGTLTGFALTGFTSNWVSPGGVTSGFTTPATTPASVTVAGNGANIVNGASTPTVSNFTDFAAAATRTFVIDNTGTGTLQVGTPYLSGANASEFSITVNPGTSVTTGTTQFIVAFTPTAAGTRTAMVNIPNSDCSKPTFSFVIQSSSIASAALNFDGTNDNVFVNNTALLSSIATGPFAMEAWIYPTNVGVVRSIIRKDGDYNLLLNTGGVLQAEAFPGGSGGGAFTYATSTASVPVNQWSHVAAVWNGSAFALYINGLAVPATTGTNTAAVSSILYLGYSFTYGQPFIGSLDEVRLWRTSRTQCEIQQYMKCEIATTSTSLVANYHFNDALANVTNTSTTLTDYSGNNHNGGLNFFALNGTTSNWIAPGGVTSGSVTPAVPSASLTIRGNAVAIAPGSVLTNTANWTDFTGATSHSFAVVNTGTGTLNIAPPVTLSGADAGSFSITAQPSTVLTTGANSFFNVTFIPTTAGTKTAIVTVVSSDCTAPNYSFVITSNAANGAAINLDGSGDYLSRPLFSAQNSNITMQAKVYLSATTGSNQVIVYNGNASSSGYGFFAANTREINILYGGNTIFSTGYFLPLTQWTSLTYVIESNGFTRFYANGLQVYSTNAGIPAAPSGSFLVGANNLGTENLNGSVDEVLFWTRALNQCEIQSNLNSEIPTTAASLTANYHFNQGAAAGNNATVTTATDASGNNNTLTLTGFALSGATSNWIAPGAVVSNYTVTAANPSTMTISGNGNAIPNGSTGTSVLNNTNFNSVPQQTFVIANSGGSLYINNILLSGGNATDFSVTSSPSFSLGSSNSNVLTIAYNSTVAGTSTAIVTVKSSNCAAPDYSFVITSSVTAGSALNLDGNDDRVILANGISSVLDPLNNITVEAWVNPTAAVALGPIIGNYATPTVAQMQFLLRQEGTTFAFYLNDGSSFKSVYTPSIVALNTWQHVAGQWDGSNLRIYVNGVLQGVTTGVTGSSFASTTNSVVMGYDFYSTPEKFYGSLDEVRIWTTVRTQCEILSYMNCEIPTTAPGLLANYHFNQGLASAANTAVNTLTSATGSYNGTLTNFNLSGATSNWVAPGGVTSGSTTPVAQTASITVSANSTSIIAGAATSTLNFTDFNGTATRTFVITNTGAGALNIGSPYLTGANTSEFSVTVIPAGTLAANATTSLVIAFTPTAGGVRSASVNIINSDCSKPAFVFAIQATAPVGEALNFDGTNDLITIPYNAALSLNSGSFTVEFQARPTIVDGSFRWVISKDNGNANLDYQVGITSTNVWRFCARNLSIDLYGSTVATPGTLYHIAAVFDGATAKLYVNGILENATNSVGTTVTNTSNVLIGARTATTPTQFFGGMIDDLRLWNVARTQCDINAYKNCEIATNATGLVANYHFNQGSAGLANPTTTVLANAAGTYTGTLSGFALTGTTSNWVSPGGVITGSFTPAAVASPTLVISGNGNTITNGSTSTNTTNLTDFVSASSRTFVIQNTSTVTANIFYGQFTGANASSFSLSTLPSTVISAGGSSSFVVAFTPTAAGSYSAMVVIKTSDCSVPNYSFVITGSVSTAAAINFDGIDDYIVTPTTAAMNMTTAATVEGWFKTTSANAQQEIFCLYNASNNGIEAQINNGKFQFNTYIGNWYNFPTAITVNDGSWHHYAVVVSGSTASGYLDGSYLGSITGTASINTGNSALYIGKHPLVSAYFNGFMDETRVWNTARTQCEVQSYMNCEIPANATGLVANYHFNQGIPSGLNLSVTTLTDAASSLTGTLNAFALTGSTSNWISPGAVISGSVTPASLSSSIALTGNSVSISNNATGTATNNLTDYNGASTRIFVITNSGTGTLSVGAPYLSGINAAEFSVTVLPATTLAASATTSFVVVFTPTAGGTRAATVNIVNSDCSKPLFNFTIKGAPPLAEALAFDGSTSYVDLGSGASLKPTAALTAEAWVFSTWPSVDRTILGNTESAGYGLFLKATGDLEGLVHRNSAFASVTTPLSGLTAGWHHVALTYNGRLTSLYVDGALKSVNDAGATYPVEYIGNNTLLGAEASSGSAPIPGWYFNGKLDEVRIWNTARSQCDIQSYMSAEIPTNATSLVANYHFNQGSSGLNNASVNTLTDATGSNNGTLQAFALTGTVSNWVAPGGVASGNTLATVPLAEINVLGGSSVTINDNTTSTSLADNTNYGNACLNTGITKTFTVQNTGSSVLTVANILVTGTDAGLFAISGSSTTITAGGNATFAVTFTPTSIGVKNATINIISSDCDESLYDFAITGTVNAVPTIATSNGLICQGQSYTLTATGANTYTYSSGPVVSPLSTTNYSITGTSAAGCVGSNTAVAQVIVDAIPNVSIAGTNTICSGGNSNFTASGASTYTWNTGATGTLVTLSPTLTTTYTVTGAYANGCSNTAVRTLSVYNTPTLTVSNGTVCPGNSFTMTPSGAVTYSYVNGGPVVNPTVTTSYSVTGASSLGCNSFPASIITVSVIASPTINIPNYSICNGSSATLSPSGAVSYTFQGGSANVSPTITTSYTVTGANASGCVNTATSTVTVNSAPALTVTANSTTICSGATSTITVSGAVSYSWSNSATTNTIAVSPTSNTTFSVTGTDANGCQNSISQGITVNPLPTVTIASGAICPGNSYTLVPSGASTYTYSSGSNVVTPAITSTYAVTGSSLGCVASASAIATVSVINTLTVSVTGNTTICEGQSTTLTANGASTYSWTNGALTSTTALSPTVNTTYTVYGASGTCSNTAVVSVSVNAAPHVSVTSGAICAGGSFTMVPSGASTYTYSSGSAIVNPVATTSYSVSGTNAIGCVSTASAVSTVTVNALPTLTIAATNNSICIGATTTLTASGATTYTWNTSVQATSIAISPTGNTSYSVSGTNTNGCVGSTSQAIVVNALPTITISNGAICPGNSYTLVPSGASTYTYSSGSNVVTPAVTSTYSILGTSSAGCVASSSAVATISVVNTLTVSVTGNTTICEGQTTTLTASGATTYSWSNGINTASVILSPTVNTTYTVFGASGTCSNTAVVSVSVNAAPGVSVTSGAICSGSSFTMVPSGAATYTYSSGSAIVSPLTNTSYSVSGTNAIGCVSTASAISTVTVNALPILTITATSNTVCAGVTTTLTASGATSYTWNGGTQTNTLPVAPASNTSYTASATGTNGCVGSASQAITVNPLPTITIPNGAICPGNSYTLVPSGAATYSYSSGSNVVAPVATSTYAILGTSALGCVASSSAIATVSVVNTLTVTVTGNTLICNGQAASLTASGATTYSWTSGSLSNTATVSPVANTTYTVYGVSGTCSNTAVVQVSVNAVPTITVNSGAICSGASFTMNPGGAVTYTYSSGSAIISPVATTSYSVSGTNAAGCVSTASAISNVTVNASPTLAIASPTSVCEGSPVTLTVSGANTYSWSNTSTATTITVTPSGNNSYSVTGTDLNGCSSTASQSIHIDPLPTITVNSGAVCPGNSFTISPSGAASYTVSGGVFTVTPVNPVSTYSVSGTSAQGCVSASLAVATVSVVHNLTISVTGNTAVCSGQSTTLTAGGASTYSWSTGATTNTVVLTPTGLTDYTVYGASGTCSDVTIVTLTVNASPVIAVNGGTVCSGSGFTLSPSGGISYTYTGGSAVINPTITTTYSVTGEDALGCVSSNTAVAEVTVVALPAVTAAISDATVCAGSTTSLSAGGATAYVWNTAQTTVTIVITPTSTTVYSVTGTDAYGCQNTATITAAISPGASLSISAPTVICEGSSASLLVSGAGSYTWSTGETSSTISVTPTITTSYSVTGAAIGSCNTEAVTTITVSTSPTITVTGADTACVNSLVMLTASGANFYSWSNGVSGPAITFSASVNDTYTVTGENAGGCSATATVDVLVKACAKLPIELVNAVTPNGDGLNEKWVIKNIEEYKDNKVSVFNRWGVEVFSATGYNNTDKSWPSKDEATHLDASTYFYIIDLKDGSKPIKGWVEIIKD